MEKKETKVFQSEVKQLLHLMIHSLYSNKEIFLRELISNSSDAIDKLKFRALSNHDLYEGDTEFYIRISYDKKNCTITVSDNGIGMCRNDVINNIGTIAKSGTRDFIKSIKLNDIKNNHLIGQFGVGFYSSFIVAEKVTIYTRLAGSDTQDGVFWESNGEGEYTIQNINKSNHGTEITLYLRKEEEEFLNEWRIRNIINKYSNHISFPIELKIKKKNLENWEKINKAQSLWTRNKNNISDNEYKDFYKNLFNDSTDPLIWSHNIVEGRQTYISLLYIPSKISFEMWNRDNKKNIKLYTQKVFIMEDSGEFLPNYLRFIRGLIDSNDLPLNISREILQDNRIVKNLKSTLTKRSLNMIEKLSKSNPEKYNTFWKNFGLILKEGLGEDISNIETISKLLRFSSTFNDKPEQNVSLEEYVGRMIPNQEKIYYITADSYTSAKHSPHLEMLKKSGIEVLLLFERIDEWMMNCLTSFDNKEFQSVSKADFSFNKLITNESNKYEEDKKVFLPLINRIKNYLGNRVKDVRITYRLSDTPSVVTTDSGDITTQMSKLLSLSGQNNIEVKYNLEINPEHILIKYLLNLDKDNIFKEWVELLLDEALLMEQNTLKNPIKFINRINLLLKENINFIQKF